MPTPASGSHQRDANITRVQILAGSVYVLSSQLVSVKQARGGSAFTPC